MLYTRKGDKGNTSFFGCKQKFSKNSVLAEALGNVDEINSFLGLCKVKSAGLKIEIQNRKIRLAEIIEKIQENLFIIQTEFAGAGKKITEKEVDYLEKIIGAIEKKLPPMKSFVIAGGDELSSLFDYGRTISRRAERKTVAFSESKKNKINPKILAYLNRLSSALYVFARICNLKSGVKEKSPSYDNL